MDRRHSLGSSLATALILLALSSAEAQEPQPVDQRRLIEQKIRLVEMLVNAQVAKSSTAAPEQANERLEKGKSALNQAREAISNQRFDEAGKILDDALRSSSSQRGQPSASLSADALRHSHQYLIEQVATDRASIEEVANHPRIGSGARTLLARIDAKRAEAGRHAGAGNLREANRLLSDAYQIAIAELSRLRAGEEVVLSLNFASPAEEYAYELRRFESNQILVTMMIDDGKAAGDRRTMVGDFETQGRRLRSEAEELARAGRHKEAATRMEMATGQLNRALQIMGVPVF